MALLDWSYWQAASRRKRPWHNSPVKMMVGPAARWELSLLVAHRQPIQAMSAIPGREATWGNIIHARAIFWSEKTQSWQWHAPLNRPQDCCVIDCWRHWPQDRPREEIAGASNRQPCLLFAKAEATAASMIASSTCELTMHPGPLKNCSAF